MAVDIANAKAKHEEKERFYWQYRGVEQELRNQIVCAIEIDYYKALINPTTDMLDASIPEIIGYLQNNYGCITKQDLSNKKDEFKNFVYNTQAPVDSEFNKINWFQDLY